MFSFLLNLPYTIVGILFALGLFPKRISWDKKHWAIILKVRSNWIGFGYFKRWRGMAIGHTVILNPREEDKDLEHELIHVEQFSRYPLIFPLLNFFELLKKGYRNNKFEDEAYTRAGNTYRGKV